MAVIILAGMELVEIAAGWFWMGWDRGLPDESPRHRVWMDDFAIARGPVTNRDYAPFLDATGSAPPPWWKAARFDDPAQPVVGVSWPEAKRFCEWLCEERRGRYRLPTEAEWEKAARGGLDDARFPWGDDRPEAGTFEAPPVATATPANRFGLVGISGVCHEWCLDWEAGDYYSVSPERNPPGPVSGTRRISRGGAWRHQDPWSPVAHRSSLPPHLQYSDYGFRVVRTSP
jgi:formylglycine-generating enzyme required for sulfatase activity